MKKLISVILVASVLMSLMTMGVFALEESDTDAETLTAPVESALLVFDDEEAVSVITFGEDVIIASDYAEDTEEHTYQTKKYPSDNGVYYYDYVLNYTVAANSQGEYYFSDVDVEVNVYPRYDNFPAEFYYISYDEPKPTVTYTADSTRIRRYANVRVEITAYVTLTGPVKYVESHSKTFDIDDLI